MKTNEEIVKECRDINGWQDKILNGEGHQLTDEQLVKSFKDTINCDVQEIRDVILPMFDSYEDGFYFDGSYNCEPEDCRWDGISRRCNCGNRRVEWVISQYNSGKIAYGEAY